MNNTISPETERFSKATKTTVVIILVGFAFIEGLAANCFLPALPAISRAFNVNIGFVQLGVSVYFLGYCAQLPYGFLSDYWGRKKIFVYSSGIFVLGSVLCVFAENYILFLAGRFLQGIGISSVTMFQSVFCDIFTDKQLESIYSFLRAVLVTVCVFAPLIGGYIIHIWNWRSIFVFILGLSILLFATMKFIFPETLNKNDTTPLSVNSFFRKILLLCNNRVMMICILCSMLYLAALDIIYLITPFFFQNILKWSPKEYGYFAFGFMLIMALGSLFNGFFIKKISSFKIAVFGSYIALLSSLLMVLNYYFPNNFITISFSLYLFCFVSGVILPNFFLLAVKSIDKEFNAGISFMFFSFIRTAGSALIIFGIAFLQLQSEAMMGILLFITSLFVLILLTILKYTNLNLPGQ